jgi:hypothetical protein
MAQNVTPSTSAKVLHVCTATFVTYNCSGKTINDISYNLVNVQSVADREDVDAYLANVKKIEQAPHVSYPLIIDQRTTMSYERVKLLSFLWSAGWIVDAGYKTSKLSMFNKDFTSVVNYYLDADKALVLVPWFSCQSDKPWFSPLGYKLLTKDEKVPSTPATEFVVSNHLFFETKQVPESKNSETAKQEGTPSVTVDENKSVEIKPAVSTESVPADTAENSNIAATEKSS